MLNIESLTNVPKIQAKIYRLKQFSLSSRQVVLKMLNQVTTLMNKLGDAWGGMNNKGNLEEGQQFLIRPLKRKLVQQGNSLEKNEIKTQTKVDNQAFKTY